jgi:translation initiation factor IF-2
LAKRISDIAKELGVNSKAIIEKCVAEGIPADKVKSHASVVSAGLELSIRDWFSSVGSGTGTAIETTQHVDIEKVKTKVPAKPRKARADGQPGDEGDVATEEPPAPAPTPQRVVPSAPAAPVMPSRPPASNGPATLPARPTEGTPVVRPAMPSGPARVTPVAPPAPVARVAPEAPGQSTSPPPPAPPAGGAPTPPAVVTPPRPTTGPHGAPPAPGAPGSPGRPGAPIVRGPVRPAPMNVPDRPKIVSPAGQKLDIKKPAVLSGPKVVRVEAPEPADTRGPRRSGGPSSGGPPRGGRGVMPSGGGGGDDGSSRRNTRRGPAAKDTSTTAAKRRPASGLPEADMPVGTGFSEADLAEREARLARAGGYLKQRRREQRAREESHGQRAQSAAEVGGKVAITSPFTIKDLSEATGVKSADIIKKLFMQGLMATVNSGIDPAKAQEIMIDFDIELDVKTAQTAEEVVASGFENRTRTDERARAPIVTIMGHVDHGKTSLLDAIRQTDVAAGEAGGITQKTSAFKVKLEVAGETKHVVFIDTPGHQAFTEMRSRGANITDIVVLVVGAPEGVMPQTVESINHAKAAKVPIVVALNKMDSPQATPNQVQKIYGQLAEQGLNPSEWGGQTEVMKTSAIKREGIKELLEVLDLQAQVLELKADFAGHARGRVVEAGLAEGRGAVATVMVLDGELKVGDCVVAGRAYGRVRDITDDQGKRIKTVGPSTPVQISGLDEVPNAGDPVFVADSLKKAEEAAEQRRQRDRQAALQQPKVTLDSLFSQMKDANVKEILIVLKADVQGSVDVIKHEVERLSTAEVKIRVLHGAVGGIQESDVVLADASRAVIVGFNVIPSGPARSVAEQKGVEIRTYEVIYDITEDVKKAATGMLEPEIRQEVLGHAEVRKVFKVSKVGTIAGCYVTDGLVQRDAFIRVTRQGIVIENERVLEQLKRFKDDAKDVRAGMECGMKIVGYDDIKEGDILECYKRVEVKRTL